MFTSAGRPVVAALGTRRRQQAIMRTFAPRTLRRSRGRGGSVASWKTEP
jgi:hypothetical protein